MRRQTVHMNDKLLQKVYYFLSINLFTFQYSLNSSLFLKKTLHTASVLDTNTLLDIDRKHENWGLGTSFILC